MIVRLDADKSRPMGDTSPIRHFAKYGRPLVHVNSGIYGKAAAWSHSYGLIEWLDASGKYRMGWAHSASIKRTTAEEWKAAVRSSSCRSGGRSHCRCAVVRQRRQRIQAGLRARIRTHNRISIFLDMALCLREARLPGVMGISAEQLGLLCSEFVLGQDTGVA
jgi:hypothetical protein